MHRLSNANNDMATLFATVGWGEVTFTKLLIILLPALLIPLIVAMIRGENATVFGYSYVQAIAIVSIGLVIMVVGGFLIGLVCVFVLCASFRSSKKMTRADEAPRTGWSRIKTKERK